MRDSNFWEMENEVSPTTALAWENATVIQCNEGSFSKKKEKRKKMVLEQFYVHIKKLYTAM